MTVFGITEADREELVQVFVAEADEVLDRLEQLLVVFEQTPDNDELLHEIFRAAHTMKGNASCLQFDQLTDAANSMEELLDAMRRGEIQPTPVRVSEMLDTVDVLRALVSCVVAGGETLNEQQKALVDSLPSGNRARRSLRVGLDKLDRMLNLVGEIAVARSHVTQLIEGTNAGEKAVDALRELDRLSFDLQETVIGVRLVPVGPAFMHFHRVVRDVAASVGKQVNLVIDGEDVEVDTTVIENLKDPLTHMVRNAIDHGIETPDERVASGKPAAGTIRISASRGAAGVVIRIADDGAGLDEMRIAERAKARGIDTERLSRQELFGLIFSAGFSTAAAVTEISGRGVGLDVVRKNVELLRGSIQIDSVKGEGATLSIHLPLTLTLIEGFSVGVGSETYVIPMDAVLECMEMPRESADELMGVIEWHGAPLSYIRLRHLFQLDAAPQARENVVVVQHARGCAGLVIDRLFGSGQSIMKPLNRNLRHSPGIVGSSILANGRVALILDVSEILTRI